MMVGGAALIILGALGRTGRPTRQWVVGLRTEATLVSEEAWKAAHEAAATWVVGAGAVLFVGGVLVRFLCRGLFAVAWFVCCVVVCLLCLCDASWLCVWFVSCAVVCLPCRSLLAVSWFVYRVVVCLLCRGLCVVPWFVRCVVVYLLCHGFLLGSCLKS